MTGRKFTVEFTYTGFKNLALILTGYQICTLIFMIFRFFWLNPFLNLHSALEIFFFNRLWCAPYWYIWYDVLIASSLLNRGRGGLILKWIICQQLKNWTNYTLTEQAWNNLLMSILSFAWVNEFNPLFTGFLTFKKG